jgi:hypothetical protein
MDRKQEKGIKDQGITASGTGTRVMVEALARRTREQGRAVKQGCTRKAVLFPVTIALVL